MNKLTSSTPKLQTHKKDKTQGLRCYGFLFDDGSFDCVKFASGHFAYIPPSRYKESAQGEFINVIEEADWLCNATFLHTKRGMVESNIRCFISIGLDLDGDDLEVPLTEDMIRQRCFMLGLPMPLIIETSPHRFHVIFTFSNPVPVTRKSWYKACQRGLHEAFEDLGSDKRLFKDVVYFQRNEDQRNSVNKKHPDKPRIIIREEGELCSLGQISDVLNRHGYMRGNDRIEVKVRLESYLRNNPEIEIKQEDLAERLSVSVRRLKDAIEALRKAGRLQTTVIGKYRGRKTRFLYTPKIEVKPCKEKEIERVQRKNKRSIQTTLPQTQDASLRLERLYSEAWSVVEREGLPYKVRNSGLWMFGLWHKLKGNLAFDGVYSVLEPAFMRSRLRGKRFSVRELRGVVRSVCDDKYQRMVGLKALRKDFDVVLIALGFSEDEIYGRYRH